MRERIVEELQKIEQTHNVKIIMAIEFGSRAWGLLLLIVIMMYGLFM